MPGVVSRRRRPDCAHMTEGWESASAGNDSHGEAAQQGQPIQFTALSRSRLQPGRDTPPEPNDEPLQQLIHYGDRSGRGHQRPLPFRPERSKAAWDANMEQLSVTQNCNSPCQHVEW
ncbi:uncharacterized [Tachysurus ichikawai]